MLQEHLPGGAAVLAFDLAMRARECKARHGQSVVHDQGMLAKWRFGPLGSTGLYLTALILGAFDEQRANRGAYRPAATLRAVVDDVPIGARPGQELNRIEAGQVHAEAPGILQKQFWMRTARDQPAGLFGQAFDHYAGLWLIATIGSAGAVRELQRINGHVHHLQIGKQAVELGIAAAAPGVMAASWIASLALQTYTQGTQVSLSIGLVDGVSGDVEAFFTLPVLRRAKLRGYEALMADPKTAAGRLAELTMAEMPAGSSRRGREPQRDVVAEVRSLLSR